MIHFLIVKGKRIFFAGRNQYGLWCGVNIIPNHFGLYVDWSYRK